ncbi:hypothetical protein P7K49_012353 [Saguinus oedipus]|uniref:Uncharacterized protein n=1 Tax=Saguinus oedipus TaxID=9490 RepID=A0ABQ9VT86_SAGOE|nr:hypothetical protein P7K49_012353 [Saguinus oedipus]
MACFPRRLQEVVPTSPGHGPSASCREKGAGLPRLRSPLCPRIISAEERSRKPVLPRGVVPLEGMLRRRNCRLQHVFPDSQSHGSRPVARQCYRKLRPSGARVVAFRVPRSAFRVPQTSRCRYSASSWRPNTRPLSAQTQSAFQAWEARRCS